MTEFQLCDIVVVTAEHPIGVHVAKTRGDIGMIAEIGLSGPQKCYRVQNNSRFRTEGFFYAPDEIRKATKQEIEDELKRLMLGN